MSGLNLRPMKWKAGLKWLFYWFVVAYVWLFTEDVWMFMISVWLFYVLITLRAILPTPPKEIT